MGVVLTLYYFTPCHYIISKALSEFISRCIRWIAKKENKEKDEWHFILIYIFLYVVIIFSSLVYNEVIIINIFSMEKNTIKYISLRERVEFDDSINNNRNSYSSFTFEYGENEEEKK